MMLLMQSDRHIALNVILALIPVALAFAAAFAGGSLRGALRWTVFTPLFIAWITFLPNTCYLWTEWRHYLHTVAVVSTLQDGRHDHDALLSLIDVTAFYVLYTGTGLVSFFLSIWPLDRMLRQRSGRAALAAQALLFQLCSLGVYLGLVDRFNTKDLLTPGLAFKVLISSLGALSHPLAGVLIVLFGLLLWFIYFICDIWMDGASLRLKRFRTSGEVH